ncbi:MULTISPECIES: hypothetical protein [unclassified Streptomyces]|uniref:hypothetical protein n=1 Tax=unclassified Streptomyces TaxID=2593676 RepID=UPI002E1428CE|nr:MULTISPECIES: hypothetical protein [unclassified Streptomyces]WSR28157.1 hypothetical protein OG573_19605 [Streptomyces sp. NBC_01205]
MVDSDEGMAAPQRSRFDAVHKWAATVAGVVALAFSLYYFTELQKKPEIDLPLPCSRPTVGASNPAGTRVLCS